MGGLVSDYLLLYERASGNDEIMKWEKIWTR